MYMLETHNPTLPRLVDSTFGAVSADALPDNELALPQHSPHQLCWATADLYHLPRERDLLPHRALWIVMANSLSEPHLQAERRRPRLLGTKWIANSKNKFTLT